MSYKTYKLKKKWYQFYLPRYLFLEEFEGYKSYSIRGYSVTKDMFDEFMRSPTAFDDRYPNWPLTYKDK